MRTDDLIDRLSHGVPATRAGAVSLRVAGSAMAAGLMAFAALFVSRSGAPDVSASIATFPFWLKFGFTSSLVALSYWAVIRISRPGGNARAALTLMATLMVAIAALAITEQSGAPSGRGAALLFGGSWDRCLTTVLSLSIPAFAFLLVGLRRMAPVNLRLAGLMAGILAGSIASAVYAFYCVETTASFLAVWYTLAIAGTAAIGAVVGPLVLKW